MNKPVLVIMAAGMGSRYGGLKQIDPCLLYTSIHSLCSAVSFALSVMFPISALLYKYFQVPFPVNDRGEG